jgi:hypothetical protein
VSILVSVEASSPTATKFSTLSTCGCGRSGLRRSGGGTIGEGERETGGGTIGGSERETDVFIATGSVEILTDELEAPQAILQDLHYIFCSCSADNALFFRLLPIDVGKKRIFCFPIGFLIGFYSTMVHCIFT